LGAAGEQVPFSEVVQGLNRGTLDGATWQPGQYISFPGAAEPLSYHATNIPVTATISLYATTPARWEEFPSDVQGAFTQAGQETGMSYVNAMLDLDERGIEEYGDQVEFYEVSDDVFSKLEPIFEDVRQNWIDSTQSPETAQDLVDTFFQKLKAAKE
jgi:TRAP-type C4-dicarboxylate transport system substrate-binding protein